MSVTLVKFYKGLVVTGCGDGIVRCFDAKSGHLLRTFEGHEGSIMALQMSGEKIFTATTDGTIRIFKIDWEFVKDYLSVLAGDVDNDLGEDQVVKGEPVKEVPLETIEETKETNDDQDDQDGQDDQDDQNDQDQDDHDSLDDDDEGDDDDDDDGDDDNDEDSDEEESDDEKNE